MASAVLPEDPLTPDPDPTWDDPNDDTIDDPDPLDPPIEEPDPADPPVEEPPPGWGA
ncbi:hypothetical protein [Truepera radiovictrix]|uniref:Glycoside hydrolase family 5 n=1 Tax=Truepera radiovictrix (strain DSM 17093 / CIP 108686 / LMG 22925 / RQ-24) TaxID=649638 RepID=D7CSJ1_TRURR|nr:hypothetical protein [Truepera radiovictrix]ADI15411.1 glycoside hydrolase family 5 [Truepera radiovictrix DSM 17093]WMT56038.1 hypothetical protein RCV51_08430 [Truepera radiovictrix]